MTRNVFIRVDSSPVIGAGHLMRCLTLAGALRKRGWSCHFLMRDHAGHAGRVAEEQAFPVSYLARPGALPLAADHSSWVGASQSDDARACLALLGAASVEWLIVDHYGLSAEWETAMRRQARRIFVIDDLHDRAHDCDVLLDHTFGCTAADYDGLVPFGCRVLAGVQYALLRPEFAAMRETALARRTGASPQRILVSLGGADPGNLTAMCLLAIGQTALLSPAVVDVVLGPMATNLHEVRAVATKMPQNVEINVGVANMAERMTAADLAIGAAGASSWERACLGLPAVLLVTAPNQMQVAQSLQEAGAVALMAETSHKALSDLIGLICAEPARLVDMSSNAARICDGLGASRVADALESLT